MKKILSLLLSFGIALLSMAQPGEQEYSIKDKKAIKKYEEALVVYGQRDLDETIRLLESLAASSSEFVEAHFMLAQVYGEKNEISKAILPLTKALEIDPSFYPEGWLMLAECHFNLGHYADAEKAVSRYIGFRNVSEQFTRRANLILSSCTFAQLAMQYPVPFEPVNLGDNINSPQDEYYPCITADEKTLLFTRLVPDDRAFTGKQEDFYISQSVDGKWMNTAAVASINSEQNEGAPSLSADGQTLIFTACENVDGMWGKDRDGIGSCDLFYSQKKGNEWSQAQNLGSSINTYAWESQPSYAADGRTLYFVRGKRTAQGIREQDIYVAELKSDGSWSRPIAVIGKVNTKDEEESVMIHPDGKTMYFSSNGHTGMGGLDIYVSHILPDGIWGEPQNLGYPINTFKDENSILVTPSGEIALFASNREGGLGGLDLYSFELHEKARPDAVTYLRGIVSDALSFKKLEAQFELIDLNNDKVVAKSFSDPVTGEFLVCIPSGHDYALNVSKGGYLFHSENFSLKNYKSLQPYHKDVELKKLKPGASVVLNNVFFDTNSFVLKEESKTELNKLTDLLKSNATVKVEIGGHTDNVGNDSDNQLLSENRAKSVVEFLIQHGIDSSRLSAKGYGETKPVATNDTEIGRAQNRRTEFMIIE